MSAAESQPVIPSEDDRLDDRSVRRVSVAGVIVTLAALAAAGALLRRSERSRVHRGVASTAYDPMALDTTPVERDDRGGEERRRQRRALERYGWVDRDGGVARVPITRAMDLVVEREGR